MESLSESSKTQLEADRKWKVLSNLEKQQLLVNLRDSKGQIRTTLKEIREGKPLFAEPLLERRKARIKSITRIEDEELLTGLANYDDTALKKVDIGTLSLVKNALSLKENQGFLDVRFLEYAKAAASSVGEIVFKDKPDNPDYYATGFMISSQLFITNNHAICEPSDLQTDVNNFHVQFNYERDIVGTCKKVSRFKFAPEKFFFGNVEKEPNCSREKLDFSIVAIGEKVSGPDNLQSFGFCPLKSDENKHAIGDFATIIQHPNGDFKQIVLRENRIAGRLGPPDQPEKPPVLHYVTDTEIGSSGSPVFNDQFWVTALHHSGPWRTEVIYPDAPEMPTYVNEGIRVSGIIDYLNKMRHSLDGRMAQPELIDEVLRCPFRGPSLVEKAIETA